VLFDLIPPVEQLARSTQTLAQGKLAVDKGEESIAKMALQEKINQEKTLNLYKEQYETIINQTKSLFEKELEKLKGAQKETVLLPGLFWKNVSIRCLKQRKTSCE
jgi:hypothetical protein